MKKIISWISEEECGQGMVEYSLIFALVVIVLIVAVKTLGNLFHKLYERSLSIMP